MNPGILRPSSARQWRGKFELPVVGSRSIWAERAILQERVDQERARIAQAQADMRAADGRVHLRSEFKSAFRNAFYSRQRLESAVVRLVLVESKIDRTLRDGRDTRIRTLQG